MKIDRQKVFNMFEGHCAYCGERIEFKKMQVDHIIPKAGGGHETDVGNLFPTCRACNNFKHVFTVEQFREELMQQVARARKRSVNFRMCEKFGLIDVNKDHVYFYFELYDEV